MRQPSATYLAAKYVNESWADVAHTHTHTTYTVLDSRSAHRPNRGTAACRHTYTSHTTQLYSLQRWALVYTHRCKSKRATDFDVNNNNSHGEHLFLFFLKRHVHYGKYPSINLYYAVFIDFCQSRILKNDSIKLSRTVDAYYSPTQPIFTKMKFSHDGQNLIVTYLNLRLDSCATVTILIYCVFFDLCGNFFHTRRITKYHYPIA